MPTWSRAFPLKLERSSPMRKLGVLGCWAKRRSWRPASRPRERAGGTLAPDVVRRLMAGKGFLFAELGQVVLRRLEDPMRLYELPCEVYFAEHLRTVLLTSAIAWFPVIGCPSSGSERPTKPYTRT